ncbi:YccF domain-containing protein [Sodalis sp.]|uniref:YccF domain-containing protein n=1 Tax=Sodalis sp. (in: enterobacteria) TaxID=1898979 RepID=UPI003872EA74
MRTLLNIIKFIFGGFLTTLAWLLATLLSVVLIISWPFTRAYWEITRLSLVPFGNTALHVDELYPERRSGLLNTGGTLLNVFWFVVFGWWLCLSHILTGIAQCCTLIGIPLGIANFKLALIAVWPVGRRVVSVEEADRLRAGFRGPHHG